MVFQKTSPKESVFDQFVSAVLLLVIVYVFVGFLLMLTWNYVIPYLFGLPKVNYLQAVALLIVALTLIKHNGVSS